MSCNCGGGNRPVNISSINSPSGTTGNNPGIIENLKQAMAKQPNRLSWFQEGVTGIAKCLGGKSLYTDEEVVKNREVCRTCEHSTKTNGKLTTLSQCMAPDPERNNAPCGCFILCKSQSGTCPIKKWTYLTISASKSEN